MKPGYITLKIAETASMDAYTARPEQEGIFPGIILLQEAYGVNAYMRGVADRLAKEGYVVIVPELYHRTAPGLEAGYQDFGAVMPYLQALTIEGLSADLQAAYDWLQGQKDVHKEKIGSVGFCMGGRVSFLANAVLPLSAAVSYYGGGIATMKEKARDLRAPHLFFWGGADRHIPPEQVETIVQALREAGKIFTNVVISQAGHAFHCDERDSYEPKAARQAWAMTLAFLDDYLNG